MSSKGIDDMQVQAHSNIEDTVVSKSNSEDTLVAKSELLLNRFQVIRTLGEGAVGAVYLVHDKERPDELIALKVLTNTIDLDDHTHERFKQEINILQEVSHPNMVKAYDYIESDDTIAYTMEYVEGDDLGTIYKKESFSYEAINNIFIQLLSALEALHVKGVWHRDIKLENIMITKDGTVKLTDLGLVKNVFNKGYTKTGVLLGTAQYMPPEYVKKANYDARGDLYAVGVVLFEMLAKRRRMANLPGNKVIEQLMETNFLIPEHELEGLSPRYVEIISKSMMPDPKERFQSASEMIAKFEFKQEPLVESPSVTSSLGFGSVKKFKPKESFVSKNKALLSLAGIVLVIAAIVFAISSSGIVKVGFADNNSAIGIVNGINNGSYSGKMNILNGGFYSEFTLEKSSDGVFIKTGYDDCKQGSYDKSTGLIECGANTMRLNIISITGSKIYGELKSLNSSQVHSFSVSK